MMVLIQMTWQPHNGHQQRRRRTSPPIGLKNLGNTCYLNSVLQCLTYTPPLAQFCLSSHHSSLCNSVFANREKECPFCMLERQIVRSLSLESQQVDSPLKIQKCIKVFGDTFRLGRQEDAHEFLRYVIDACHNTCLKLIKKLSSSSSSSSSAASAVAAAASPSAGSTTSVMKEIFGGALLSQVKCLSCKGESNKTDEIMDISLDLYQSNSLKEALGRFFQPELLDGNNKYNCSKCKNLCVAKKQMFILRAPNVLVIQLKRFEGIHGGKINRNIEFEEGLVLSKFMYSTSQDLQPEYNLFGSIVHSGFSPESGHYYAYIKDSSGRWYCCNDALVSLSSTQEVLSEKVYILFYLRNNQSPRSSKIGFPCNALPSDSNVIEGSSHQKSGELSKAPTIRPNGVSSKINVPTFTKNGKMSTNPHIKPFIIKSTEMKKAVANGNGNLGAHSNGSVDKNGNNKLPIPKKTILRDNDSVEKIKVENKAELVLSKSIAGNGYSSDFVENSKKQKLQLHNGNGCSNRHKEDMHDEKATQLLVAVNRELGFNPSENDSISKSPKRKLSNAERDVGSDICTKETCRSSRNDASCKILTTGHRKGSEELEKFKEVITSEASSDLRSCGWVDKVHSYMQSRKRLCTQTTGSCPDNSQLRRQLIADAKKTFISQIPESLKEHLVERLRLFSQGNSLFDA